MLFKLSLRSILRSIKDYMIYFFTLVIGVLVFYVFNAIGTQTAMLKISEEQNHIIEIFVTLLSGISVFVAIVLGLLIIYANRFLMKRRKKEFALYLLLGMSKKKVSAILFIETIIVGLGSLLVGLILGVGFSQFMSALVVNLFEADMNAYKFCISPEAIIKTIIYFAVIYLIVMIFNGFVITRIRLINLIQSGKKSERIKLKNPFLCVLVFLVSAVILGLTYYQVGWNINGINMGTFMLYAAIGSITTFFIFWSLSGMLLRIFMSLKNIYYRGLNSFTFRQISSKVNTMVFSMTVICLMLFLTICALSCAFTIRNSMNANLEKYCTADFEIRHRQYSDENYKILEHGDIIDLYAHCGSDATKNLKNYVHFHSYFDPSVKPIDDITNNIILEKKLNMPDEIVTLSDYNKLMSLYGINQIKLDKDEFVLVCDFKYRRELFDKVLKKNMVLEIFDHKLKSRHDKCVDGFIDISSGRINFGFFVVPDYIVDESHAGVDYLVGNYDADTKEEMRSMEKISRSEKDSVEKQLLSEDEIRFGMFLSTKSEIFDENIGASAMITFIALYIGMIFLIVCGAILALKELSETVDSVERYKILRKIGADENNIYKSLFHRTSIFFLMPLIFACIHSVFGMKFAINILEFFGTEKIPESITITTIAILIIYGGYFMITYFCSKNIIKEKR